MGDIRDNLVTPEQINQKDFRQVNRAKKQNLAKIGPLQEIIQNLTAKIKERDAKIRAMQLENSKAYDEIFELTQKIQAIHDNNQAIDDQVTQHYEASEEEING